MNATMFLHMRLHIFKIAAILTVLSMGAALVTPQTVYADPGTQTILADVTGGDCTNIGTWDLSTLTCTLSADTSESIIIANNGITLDGGGFSVITSSSYGISASNVSGVHIQNVTARGNSAGVNFYQVSGSTVTDSLLAMSAPLNSGYGLILQYSSGNRLERNTFQDSTYGLVFGTSGNNILRDNVFANNKYHLRIGFNNLYNTLANDVDTSNVADGKPIYYLVGASNITIGAASNASTVWCVNCTNVTIENLTLEKNSAGIFLFNTTGSTVRNIQSQNNEQGIYLVKSNGNTLLGNQLFNNYDGVVFEYSNQNTMANSLVNKHYAGVRNAFSSGNTLIDNTLTQDYYGITLDRSSNTTMRGNTITGSGTGFWITSIDDLSYFENDIDTSNLIEGKPIYYLKDVTGQTFDAAQQISTLWCIRCQNIVVSGLQFSKNGVGVGVVNSQNIEITDINVYDSSFGVIGYGSQYINVDSSTFTNNARGVYLEASSDGEIRSNNFISNWRAIWLEGSNNNQIYKNFIGYSGWYEGVLLGNSSSNTIYQNNFLSATNQVSITNGAGNLFSMPLPKGGNYWVNFDTSAEGCTDTNTDGFCDAPYTFTGGSDSHPLVLPLTRNQHPVAEAGGLYTGITGSAITLDASDSSDPDSDPLTYEWDLDQDGEYDDAAGVTTTTVFNQVGQYSVGLRVSDPLGLSDTDMATVMVGENPANFRIFVEPNEDNVYAWGWAAGTQLTLTIDDPDAQGIEYTAAQTSSGEDDWDHGFKLAGIIDIKPKFVVTVSGGGITKEHVVTPLAVTDIDIDADTVSGIGLPGSYVHVGTICDGTGCANRNITVDQDGNWIADFSAPEAGNINNGIVFDLRPGSGSGAFEHDADNDTTKVNWSVINPLIGVDVDIDRVQGWDWPLGASVMFEIDDPSTPGDPDYSHIAIAHVSDWDPNLIWFEFKTENYDLKPGDTVRATDGNTTKQLLVIDYRITGADLGLDIVYGVANPGQEVAIWTHDQNDTSISRRVTADEHGNWSANFGIPGDEASEQGTIDIRNGMWFDSFVTDEDGDNTRCMWDTPNPTLEVRANADQVSGSGWTLGSKVTITVDDPGTQPDPDVSRTAVLYEAPWNPREIRFDLDLSGVIDIQTGFEVTASDDDHNAKTHVVQSFGISDIDLNTDTVTGYAPPNSTVYIWTCWQESPCSNREETTDQNGSWVTNFAVPGEQDWEQTTNDLRPGSWIDSAVSDEDGDSTIFGRYIEIPNIEASPDGDWVVARGWPNGTVLTLTIDDPNNGPGIEKSMDITMGPSSWDPNDIAAASEPMDDFDLQPGDIIKVTDGTVEAVYIPTNLTVASFDLNADTISGFATPGEEIQVWVGVSGPHILRYVTADAVTGSWTADYGHVGVREDEQQLFDFQPGSVGFVKEIDTDGNATHVAWHIPDNRPPIAHAGLDQSTFINSIIILDAAPSSDPDGDPLNYEWDLDYDGQYDDATGVNATMSFTQVGDHVIGLRVTDTGGLSDIDTLTVTIQPWTIKGFYQPVDMNGVYNVVRGGSTVPLKFEIFASATELTNLADVKSILYTEVSCNAIAAIDQIEYTVTGDTNLRYDAQSGQFIYNWKTPKTVGQCYRVTLITLDSSALITYFKTK